MCTQTEDESLPVVVFEDIIAERYRNHKSPTRAGCFYDSRKYKRYGSYLHAMLDGIEQNKDNDIPLSNPICSANTPVVKIEPDRKIFNHVFIGNVLPDTTVEEVGTSISIEHRFD